MECIMTESIERFQEKILEREVNLHSFLLMEGGRITAQWYRPPYGRETRHRMFSITKSLTSLAIGFLEEEGKLCLTDSICQYFPEFAPEDGEISPWLKECRIVDMLRMESCHSMTTYKQIATDRWVESFFRVKPNHCPGTVFSYDTSASIVMTALAEKLSGRKLLDYLREKVFDAVGIFQDAYVSETPDGVSNGGSGLMGTTEDLARLGHLLNHLGNWQGKQLLPENYLLRALNYQTGTGLQGVVDERKGYGYQFWLNRKGGFVLYGMGGQLVMCFPEYDAVFVTTAYTHGDPAGQQSIYDAFYEYIYPEIVKRSTGPAHKAWTQADYRRSFLFAGTEAVRDGLGRTYVLQENPAGWKSFRLEINEDVSNPAKEDGSEPPLQGKARGSLRYENRRGNWEIPFVVTDQPADNRSFAQGERFLLENREDTPAMAQAWIGPANQLLLRVELLDEEPGVLWMEFGFRDGEAAVHLKRSRELYLEDYEGFCSGAAAE